MTAPPLAAIDLSALPGQAPDLSAIDLSALGGGGGSGEGSLTPPLNAIDLSALPTNAPDLNAIDLSALGGGGNNPDPVTGAGSAAVTLSVIGSGSMPLFGEGAASLELSASGSALFGLSGVSYMELPLSAAGAALYGFSGGSDMELPLSAEGSGSVLLLGEGMATLSFSASGSARHNYSGTGDSKLRLSASSSASQGFSGSSDIELVLSASSAALQGFAGSGSGRLSVTASGAGYQDWLVQISPLQFQEIYRLVVTGAADGLDDLNIGGISSWQATNQADGRSSYVQAVIPAAESILPDIEARKNGDLVIQKGFKFEGSGARYEEVLRSRFDTIRPDRGKHALTVTVSGYLPGKNASIGGRNLTGVRAMSTNNGKRRVRCEIDMFLQPGMSVTAMGESFRVGYINYYVSRADKFCEVGER